MARQPAFGRGVRPELMLADYSPIVAGGQAMGAGLASAGASIGQALKERGEMKKDIAAAESSAKALLNNPNLDQSLRATIESTQQQLDNPDLSLRQQHGIATQANQTLGDALRLGAYGMQQQAIKAADAERVMRAEMEQQKMDALKEYRTGTLDQGARGLDLKEREVATKESRDKPTLQFHTDPGTNKRILTYGNSVQQINLSTSELTTLEKDLAAIDRQRLNAGQPPLTPAEKVKATELYASRKAQGSSSEDAMQLVQAQMMAKTMGLPMPTASTPQSMFNGAPAAPANPATPPAIDPASIATEFKF